MNATRFSTEKERKEFLSDLQTIRKRAKELKLKDKEVDDLYFYSDWIGAASPTRLQIRTMLKALWKCLDLVMVCLCAYIFIAQTPYFDKYVNKYLPHSGFPALRFARKFAVSTGLTDWLISRDAYHMNCLVENLLFEPPEVSCHRCLIKDVEEIQLDSLNAQVDFRNMSAFVLRSSRPVNLSIVDVQRVYQPHATEARDHTKTFVTNTDLIGNLSNFLESDWIEEVLTTGNETLQPFLVWRVSHYNVSRHFRSIFPRAPFVPMESEVRLEKMMFAYNAQHRSFRIRSGVFEKSWLYQARGSRCFKLYPPYHCHGDLNSTDQGPKDTNKKSDSDLGASESETENLGDFIDVAPEEKRGGQNPSPEESSEPVCQEQLVRLDDGDFLYIHGEIWFAVSVFCEDEAKPAPGEYGITYVGVFK